jgi:hypothetical protein
LKYAHLRTQQKAKVLPPSPKEPKNHQKNQGVPEPVSNYIEEHSFTLQNPAAVCSLGQMARPKASAHSPSESQLNPLRTSNAPIDSEAFEPKVT